MNLFIDTNVLIDYLADRQPFAEQAAEIFNCAELGLISIHISAVSYNNIYYILKRSLTHTATIKILDEITEMVQIAEVNDVVIKKSLKSNFKDFEDAIQYNSALLVPKLKAIVSRNIKDFKHSTVAVLSPTELLALINSEK
ncbi:MAG: PIN domain-containing protein [Chitinophagaceae bacterium]|nr:PIN domain-containing protein [Chitinophagaceae bacterium]